MIRATLTEIRLVYSALEPSFSLPPAFLPACFPYLVFPNWILELHLNRTRYHLIPKGECGNLAKVMFIDPASREAMARVRFMKGAALHQEREPYNDRRLIEAF